MFFQLQLQQLQRETDFDQFDLDHFDIMMPVL